MVKLQYKAYDYLMKETEKPVDWAYEAWDELVEGLTHKDNHVRAISSQILTHLAMSDPKGRIFKDFDKLLNVTRDERFVTRAALFAVVMESGFGWEETAKAGCGWFGDALPRMHLGKELHLDPLRHHCGFA